MMISSQVWILMRTIKGEHPGLEKFRVFFYLHIDEAYVPRGCRGLGRIKHVFNEDAIALRWVIHQNVCHCANKFSILKDRAAGHALHDTTGLVEQCGIGHFNEKIPAMWIIGTKRADPDAVFAYLRTADVG